MAATSVSPFKGDNIELDQVHLTNEEYDAGAWHHQQNEQAWQEQQQQQQHHHQYQLQPQQQYVHEQEEQPPLAKEVNSFHVSRPLQKGVWWSAGTVLTDMILAAIPLLFIVLAICCLRLDDQPRSRFGDSAMSIALVGPTIYPIVFTAIMARLMRSIAHWLAERGSTLGTLEQLVQSQSLASSLESIVTLRAFTLGGLIVLLGWALSPLGGQSVLRLLQVGSNPIYSTRNVLYPRSDTMNYFGESSHYVPQAPISAIFMASLVASDSIKASSVDPWNNVKVPAIQQVHEDADSEGWMPVSLGASNAQTFTSLVGVPLWNIPSTGKTNFTMQWSSMTPNCTRQPDPTKAVWDKTVNITSGFAISTSWDGKPSNPNNTASSLRDYINLQFSSYGPHGTRPAGANASDMSQYPYGYQFNCTLRSTRVEASVLCDGGNCEIDRVRQSLADTRPDLLLPWNSGICPSTASPPLLSLTASFKLLQTSGGAGAAFGYASPVEAFLNGSAPLDIISSLRWDNVTGADFSLRFGQVWNAFYLATQLSGSLIDDGRTGAPSDLGMGGNGSCARYFSSQATVTDQVEVYKAQRAWIAVLVAVSLVLVACCVANLVLRMFTTTPEIFGFVSSLTRDNPYSGHLVGGSYMGGQARTRELKDLKVRIADVKPGEDIGRLAFVAGNSGHDGGLPGWIGRVSKHRLYE